MDFEKNERVVNMSQQASPTDKSKTLTSLIFRIFMGFLMGAIVLGLVGCLT